MDFTANNPFASILSNMQNTNIPPPQNPPGFTMAPMFGGANPFSVGGLFPPQIAPLKLLSNEEVIRPAASSLFEHKDLPIPGQFHSNIAAEHAHGELITNRFTIYHSIESIANLVQEEQNLSLHLKVSKAKVFEHNESTFISFINGDKELSLLQQDQHRLLQNILKTCQDRGRLTGTIIDFAMAKSRFLYLLYKNSVVFLDVQELINNSNSSVQYEDEVKLVDSIQFKTQPSQYNRIEIGNNQKSLFLVNKTKAEIVQIDLEQQNNMKYYTIDNCENRSIRDIDLYQHYLCVLYDKNEVAVYNTIKNELIFKSRYQDAADTITRLFYVANFDTESDEEAEDRDANGEQSNEKQKNKNLFQGNFILIETKTQKSQQATAETTVPQSEKEGLFRRINLVEIINTEKQGPGNKKVVDQKLHLIDFLRISDSTTKLVEYNREKGILFLLNKAKPEKNMLLCTVKLKSGGFNDSESDEGLGKEEENSSKLKFEFVTECRLKLNNMVIQTIQMGNEKPKPKFMKIIFSTQSSDDTFHLYISVAGQVLVYARPLNEVIPSIGQSLQQLVKTASNTMGSPKKYLEENPPLLFSQPQPFGIIPEIQKKPKILGQKIPTEYIMQQATPKLDRNPDDVIKEIDQYVQDAAEEDQKILDAMIDQEEIKEQKKNDDYKSLSAFETEIFNRKVSQYKTPDTSQSQHQLPKEGKRKKNKAKKTPTIATPSQPQQQQMFVQQQQQPALSKNVQSSQSNQKQITSSPGKSVRQSQQDSIIDNYNELAKKFQELNTKYHTLTQQLQTYSNQVLNIEKEIQKSVKEYLPSMLENNLKHFVVPHIVQQMKTVDKQIEEDIMPKMQNQIVHILMNMKDSGFLGGPSHGAQKGQQPEISEQSIKEMIHKEFKEAMETYIVPQIAETLKTSLQQVHLPLKQINKALFEKLAEEEQRGEDMVQYYKQSLDSVIGLHDRFATKRPAPPMYDQQQQYMMPPQQMYYPQYPPQQQQQKVAKKKKTAVQSKITRVKSEQLPPESHQRQNFNPMYQNYPPGFPIPQMMPMQYYNGRPVQMYDKDEDDEDIDDEEEIDLEEDEGESGDEEENIEEEGVRPQKIKKRTSEEKKSTKKPKGKSNQQITDEKNKGAKANINQ